jgi:hypothetical protein
MGKVLILGATKERGRNYAPVRTMTMAMLMLIPLSMLPMMVLTTTLLHRKSIRGLSQREGIIDAVNLWILEVPNLVMTS